MPYKSGAFQAALGAICTIAFLVANAFSSGGDTKHKRATGILQKTGDQSVTLIEDNARQTTFCVPESAAVFLNAQELALADLPSGRKASIRYTKKKGLLIAEQIDLFPTHSDFDPPSERR